MRLFLLLLMVLNLPSICLADSIAATAAEAQKNIQSYQQHAKDTAKALEEASTAGEETTPPPAQLPQANAQNSAAPNQAAAPPAPTQAATPMSQEQLAQLIKPEDIKAFLDSPIIKKILTAMGAPEFFPNINLIRENPDLKKFMYIQAGFIVFMLLLRIFMQSRAQSFLGKLWVSIYCLGILWAGTLYYLPSYILGEPYKKIALLFWNAFTK